MGSNRGNAYLDYNNIHWPCLANTSFLAANPRKTPKFSDRSSKLTSAKFQQSAGMAICTPKKGCAGVEAGSWRHPSPVTQASNVGLQGTAAIPTNNISSHFNLSFTRHNPSLFHSTSLTSYPSSQQMTEVKHNIMYSFQPYPFKSEKLNPK